MDAIERRFGFKPARAEGVEILLRCLREFQLFQRVDRVNLEIGAVRDGADSGNCALCIIVTETRAPNASRYGGFHSLRETFPDAWCGFPIRWAES